MEREIGETNGVRGNGSTCAGGAGVSGPANAVAQRPLRRGRIRVEVEVPESLMGEFDLMVQEVLAGPRTRLTLLEQEFKAIETRGLAGLAVILDTVRSSSGGQVARLVRFLACLYLKYDCPFELTDLRSLDTALANACLDYLNYDRLGICDLEEHLPDGGAEVEGWIRDYGYVPRSHEG